MVRCVAGKGQDEAFEGAERELFAVFPELVKDGIQLVGWDAVALGKGVLHLSDAFADADGDGAVVRVFEELAGCEVVGMGI